MGDDFPSSPKIYFLSRLLVVPTIAWAWINCFFCIDGFTSEGPNPSSYWRPSYKACKSSFILISLGVRESVEMTYLWGPYLKWTRANYFWNLFVHVLGGKCWKPAGRWSSLGTWHKVEWTFKVRGFTNTKWTRELFQILVYALNRGTS